MAAGSRGRDATVQLAAIEVTLAGLHSLRSLAIVY
jgi:hypothetical protein